MKIKLPESIYYMIEDWAKKNYPDHSHLGRKFVLTTFMGYELESVPDYEYKHQEHVEAHQELMVQQCQINEYSRMNEIQIGKYEDDEFEYELIKRPKKIQQNDHMLDSIEYLIPNGTDLIDMNSWGRLVCNTEYIRNTRILINNPLINPEEIENIWK